MRSSLDRSADHLVFFAVEPFVDRRSSKTPEFAYLNPDDFSAKDHTLERSGMSAEHGRDLVAVEQRLDAVPAWHPQVVLRCRWFSLVVRLRRSDPKTFAMASTAFIKRITFGLRLSSPSILILKKGKASVNS